MLSTPGADASLQDLRASSNCVIVKGKLYPAGGSMARMRWSSSSGAGGWVGLGWVGVVLRDGLGWVIVRLVAVMVVLDCGWVGVVGCGVGIVGMEVGEVFSVR